LLGYGFELASLRHFGVTLGATADDPDLCEQVMNVAAMVDINVDNEIRQ
jgi:hypothetical protein